MHKIKLMYSQNWLKLSKFFSFREKMLVSFLVLISVSAFLFWIFYGYLNLTRPIPKAGGDYTEGIVGQPLYVNPLLSQSSEADADLVQLIYSGLFKYDKDGKLVNDLAERYELSEDQKVYTVYLKKDILWHNGKPLTAEDVAFTINILQDPSYKSPLRQNWQGIEVGKIDDYTLKFSLKNPYFGFLDNLTIGIVPKHIWENIAPEKFSLTEYNLKPIGSGPYKYFNMEKDSSGNITSYQLTAFEKYSLGAPYIQRIVFNFYPDEEKMIEAYNKKQIKGMENILPESMQNIKNIKTTKINEIQIPRYFSVFLNITKSVPIANDQVRQALRYAVDKNEILEKVLKGKGIAIHSPFVDGTDGYNGETEKYDFNRDKANHILDEAGWERGEDGIRQKNGTKLQFEIYTTDWPELSMTAEILKEQWKQVGAEVETKSLTFSDLNQNHIRTREYSSLLLGQVTSFNPDLYAHWHSSQKDTGLNLALFNNEDADEILRSARSEMNDDVRNQKYKEFQTILAEKNPAVFLYSPYYLYPVSRDVKGMEISRLNSPAWRFADVNKWYVKTKRILK